MSRLPGITPPGMNNPEMKRSEHAPFDPAVMGPRGLDDFVVNLRLSSSHLS